MRIQCQMWRNHHATTILNFLVAQIAAIVSLIQFEFDKSRHCHDTVMKKAFPPSLPPSSRVSYVLRGTFYLYGEA